MTIRTIIRLIVNFILEVIASFGETGKENEALENQTAPQLSVADEKPLPSMKITTAVKHPDHTVRG